LNSQTVRKGLDATPLAVTKDGYNLIWDGNYRNITKDEIVQVRRQNIEQTIGAFNET
jgi:hypothetical protein